jgi:hypothetical protein
VQVAQKAKAHYLLDDEDILSSPFKKMQIKKFCVYFFLRLKVPCRILNKVSD